MKVTRMKEKPTTSFASNNLRTPKTLDYLSFFGLYALKSHIFPIIFDQLQSNVRDGNGTFNLTDALNAVNKLHEVYAVEVKGCRYDLTNPAKYAEAVSEFSKNNL